MLVVLDWPQVARACYYGLKLYDVGLLATAYRSNLALTTQPVRTAQIFQARWILSSPDLSPNFCACASTFRGTVASPKLSSAATLSSIDKLGRKKHATIILYLTFLWNFRSCIFGVNVWILGLIRGCDCHAAIGSFWKHQTSSLQFNKVFSKSTTLRHMRLLSVHFDTSPRTRSSLRILTSSTV